MGIIREKLLSLLTAVPCNETRLFGISPYKLVIFTCLEITLTCWKNCHFFMTFRLSDKGLSFSCPKVTLCTL